MIRISMLAAMAAFTCFSIAHAHEPHTCPDGFPDAPILSGHIEHGDIVDGRLGQLFNVPAEFVRKITYPPADEHTLFWRGVGGEFIFVQQRL